MRKPLVQVAADVPSGPSLLGRSLPSSKELWEESLSFCGYFLTSEMFRQLQQSKMQVFSWPS